MSLNSNPVHQESFLNAFFSKRILADIEPMVTEENQDTIQVFAFCPSCGYNNEGQFAFCPSCGNDLKQNV